MLFSDQLRLAVAAYLARFQGPFREHIESGLRSCLAWCAERGLDPLTVRRLHLELYIRWMQEIRHFKPSTVSRRFLGRRRVLPDLRHRWPARPLTRRARPTALGPAGVTDAGIHPPAVRSLAHRCPRVAETIRIRAGRHARLAGLADLPSHQRGHRRPRRGARPPGAARLRQRHQGCPDPAAASGRWAIDRAIGSRSSGPILLNSRGARMDRHPATRRLRRLAEAAGVRIARPHPHMLRHTFATAMLDAGVDLRDVQIAARPAGPRTAMRHDRARKNPGRHPNYILAAHMASGT